jgi:hypothetical protein
LSYQAALNLKNPQPAKLDDGWIDLSCGEPRVSFKRRRKLRPELADTFDVRNVTVIIPRWQHGALRIPSQEMGCNQRQIASESTPDSVKRFETRQWSGN